MVDLDILKKFGVSAEAARTFLTTDKLDKEQEKKRSHLKNLIRSRIQEGRNFNIEHYKLFYALDQAWDTCFQQINPTLLSSLIDKDPGDKCVLDSLKSWGFNMEEVLREVPDKKTPGKNIKQLNVPAFFKIIPPLTMAYVKMRHAKIVNDRRLVPFMKFEPSLSDEKSRFKCHVVTNRVEVMANQYGYFNDFRDASFKALHYADQMMLPREEWHTEEQVVAKDYPVDGEDVKVGGEVVGKKVIVKEGLRYHRPHPTRTFWDRAYPTTTFNHDTGCSYIGYWRVVRYSEVRDNAGYFNTDKVLIGDPRWLDAAKANGYFENVFQGCVMNWPTLEMSVGVSKQDSEAYMATRTYTSDWDDKSICLTEYFQKLVPKDFGLGDYEHAIWWRFVVAADDTICYAAPLPYNPAIYWGYDPIDGRTHTPSMTLEIMPFQDQFGNLLTQFLASVRQNLANLTMVDTDQLDEGWIKKIEGAAEQFWRGLNIVRFSSKKARVGQNNPPQAAFGIKFPQMDTVSLMSAMKMVIDILERILVMSAQEVAQSASHEQTREEIRNISASTSSRSTYTATPMDIAIDAWKRQIYSALMAYGSKEFWVEVPLEKPVTEQELNDMGFTVRTPPSGTDMKVVVKAEKTAIAYESFISNRDGDDRINDTETAKAMILFFNNLMQNAMTQVAIGPEQAIKVANMIGKFAGFPRDFKLVNVAPEQPQGGAGNDVATQLKTYVDQVAQSLNMGVQKGMEEMMKFDQKQEQEIQASSQAVQQHNNEIISMRATLDVLEKLLIPTPQPPAPPVMPMAQPMMAPQVGGFPIVPSSATIPLA